MSGLLSHFFNSYANLGSFPPQKVKKAPRIQDIQNIALVLGIEKLERSHLNLNFLKEKKIIDAHWQLSPTSPKIASSSHVIQLNFQNGLTLMGLPKSLILRENIHNDQVNDLVSPTIIKRYVNSFANSVYQSLTVNLQRIFNLPNQQSFLSNYTKNNLLNQSIFFERFYPLLQSDIHWKYQLERCQLNFRTKLGNLRPETEKEIPFFLFLGGFKYRTYHFYPHERVKKVEQSLSYLEQDYKVFQELIENRFLG